MRVALLGPLSVTGDDGRVIKVAGRRLQALLLRLAVDADRTVSGTELVEAVWPDDPPADPVNALQSLVSRLRRALGQSGVIEADGTGYRLRVPADAVDSSQFRALVAEGRRLAAEDEPAKALDVLARAEQLWRGEPLAEAEDAWYAAGFRAQLSELRLGASLDRLRTTVDLGRGVEAIPELDALAEANPLHEPVLAVLLRALAAAGRAPEALARYETTRRFFTEELGTDPGAELQSLHLRLLRGEVVPPTEAVASPPARRSNLRAALTSFVGREEDLSRVLATVDVHRLTTLVGPGGSGKTRLAVEAARRWLAANNESAWLVELAPVTDADNLAAAVLSALGLRETRVTERTERPAQDAPDRLLDRLREAGCLLVMDNCEHLIEPVTRLVDDLLAAAPRVRVLATSRELLGLTGEALCPIPPLPLPPANVPLAEAPSYPAVRLWLDRADAVQPDFVLNDGTLGPVVEIVRRLDGLPLAIELAAARLRVFGVADIAQRLSDRFRLLTGGNRTSMPRHRTLRAVVEWSWDLLSPAERLLAERLAVFPAGAELPSVLAVCADDRLPADDIETILGSLVDKSLLQAEVPAATGATGVRYRMLETIREYGVERLAERGELAAARLAHAEHYGTLAVECEPVLRTRDQLPALARLNLERDNVLAAIRYLGDSGRGEQALTVLLALAWYWATLDATNEMATWAAFVLEANAGADLPNLVYARTALVLADLGGESGAGPSSWDEVRRRLGELSEELVAAPPPPFPSLDVLRAMVAAFAGQAEVAQRLLADATRSPDRWLRAAVHAAAANLYENAGELDRMRASLEIAYPEFVELGDRWGLSTTLIARAQLATLDGDLDAAIEGYREARRQIRELKSIDDELYIHVRLADLYFRRGDFDAARDELDALQAMKRVGRDSERELFARAAVLMIEWHTGRTESALELARWLRDELRNRISSVAMLGHLRGVILSATGLIAALSGDLEQAGEDLTTAYASALETMDQPIVAAVGTAVAGWLAARGRSREAAVALAAAATVRGAEDRTDRSVRAIRDTLRSRLGPAFEPAYAEGRALARAEAQALLDPKRYLP